MDRKSNFSPFKKWLQVRDSREISGARGETRTPDTLLRRQTLYPTELRAHFVASLILEHFRLQRVIYRSGGQMKSNTPVNTRWARCASWFRVSRLVHRTNS